MPGGVPRLSASMSCRGACARRSAGSRGAWGSGPRGVLCCTEERGRPVLCTPPCPAGLSSSVTPARQAPTRCHSVHQGPVMCGQVAARLSPVDSQVDRRLLRGPWVIPEALGPSQYFLEREPPQPAPAWARQAWGGDCSPEKEILNEKLTQGWKFTGFQVVLTFHAPAAVSLENKHCRVETMPPVSPAAAGHKGGCPPSSPRALVEAGPEKPEGPGPSARLQTRPRRAPPAPAWRLQPRLPPPGPAPARRLLRQRVAKGDVKTAGLGACAGQPLGRNGFRGVCGPWQPAERRSRAQPRP